MKVREVIDKILAYHPDLGADYNGCDQYKCGDPEVECTGVVAAMSATIHVVERAIELGANLIVVHEPTFYTTMDDNCWHEDFPSDVYDTKRRMLDEHGIVIWRDHDHMHAHQPDGIFTGVLKYLGWLPYHKVDADTEAFAHFIVDLPEAMTLEQLMKHLTETIGMNGARYMGDPNMTVKKVALVGHLMPMMLKTPHKDGTPREYAVQIIDYLEKDIDVIIPGEIIDWTLMSYLRDAVQLGKKKGMINLGHYNWEELGMRYTREWLAEMLAGELEVTYVPSEDMYSFYTCEA